jgi:predicted DNA-binding protein (MmcQ/YjbR family)
MVKTLGMPSPTGSHADYLRFALGFPEAWQDTPWDGDVVAKVGKKIFVFFGTGEVPSVGVKLPQSAEQALLSDAVTPMAYGLGKWGWVVVRVDGADAPEQGIIEDWIEESYRAVAPKKLIAQLPQQ